MKKYLVLGAVAVFAVMAAGSTANAAMGVGVKWGSNGASPEFVLPIKLASGMVIEPSLAFESVSSDAGSKQAASFSGDGTAFRVGVAVEKYMDAVGAASPLFGAKVMIDIGSPDVGDSYTDIGFSLYVGGSAALADNLDIVGYWGPEVLLIGERSPNGPTSTIIGSRASLMVRWWLWGM